MILVVFGLDILVRCFDNRGFDFSDGLSLGLNLLLSNVGFLLDLHGVGKVGRRLSELIKSVSNGIVLLSDNTRFLLFKVNSKFIVNERDDHTVMERDEVGRLVLSDLTEGFHEDESSIA